MTESEMAGALLSLGVMLTLLIFSALIARIPNIRRGQPALVSERPLGVAADTSRTGGVLSSTGAGMVEWSLTPHPTDGTVRGMLRIPEGHPWRRLDFDTLLRTVPTPGALVYAVGDGTVGFTTSDDVDTAARAAHDAAAVVAGCGERGPDGMRVIAGHGAGGSVQDLPSEARRSAALAPECGCVLCGAARLGDFKSDPPGAGRRQRLAQHRATLTGRATWRR